MSSFDVYSFIYASGDFQFLLGEVRITHHKYTASFSNTQTNKHSLLQSHTQTLTHAVSLSLSRSLTAHTHTHSLSIWLTHLVGGKNKLWERSQCVTLSVFLSICLFVYGIEWTFIMSFIVCWIVWEGCKCAFVSSILFSSACFAFRLICPFFFFRHSIWRLPQLVTLTWGVFLTHTFVNFVLRNYIFFFLRSLLIHFLRFMDYFYYALIFWAEMFMLMSDVMLELILLYYQRQAIVHLD